MSEPVADLAQLRRWAADSASRREFSPLGSQPLLLIDTAVGDDPAVAGWLASLPCPVLGIGPDDAPLASSCDACVASVDAALPLLANIRRTPLAASVLCQLLRTTHALPVEEALLAESLAYSTLQAGPEYRRWLLAQSPAAPRAPEPGPAVIVERTGEELALTLNRPANRNAISVEVRDALLEAFELALEDDTIRRIVLAGAGRCFSVGGELAEFGSVPDPATGHAVRSLALPARLLARCADRVTVRVHGACIGAGVELPSFAQRVVAAPDAFFQLPELRFGLIPGAGGTVGIARRIGRQRMAWLALSGKRIGAAQALAWGLVDTVDRVTKAGAGA